MIGATGLREGADGICGGARWAVHNTGCGRERWEGFVMGIVGKGRCGITGA